MASVLLLSGGIDSICLAAWKRPALCLTVNYGQRAIAGEVRSAAATAKSLGLAHEILTVPTTLGAGIMAGQERSALSDWDDFWPFRNQLLITYAASVATKKELTDVMIGTVANDTRHADGSAQFISKLGELLAIQEGALTLSAPAVTMTSIELVSVSGVAMDVLAYAHSCHRSEFACGNCPGCTKHSSTMRSLGWDR